MSINNKTEVRKISPPRLIPSIVAGFNAIANNIFIIVFPVGLDLLFWFGPHISLKSLLQPFVNAMFAPLSTLPSDLSSSTEITLMVQAARDLWQSTLEHFNLLVILRSYPVGIPSLNSSLSPLNNPLSPTSVFDVSSIIVVALLWLFFYLSGLLFGTIFFNEISRHTNQQLSSFSLWIILRQYLQVLGLTITFILLILLLTLPSIIFITLLAFINPIAAQLGVMFISFVLLWLTLPLIFSAHGIFVQQQNFLLSILSSIRLVRFTFPTTGMFLLIVLLISQGLDVLWRTPPETSWMSLIGIMGHAFISSSLLAASFFYYRGGISWILEVLHSKSKPNGNQSQI